MISNRSKVLAVSLLFVLSLPASAISLHDRAASRPVTPAVVSRSVPEPETPPEFRPEVRSEPSSRGEQRPEPPRPVYELAGVFNASAYTADDPTMNGSGVTATGVEVQEWHTVAVDPSVIALGTTLYIPYFKDMPNHGYFVAQDTGGAIRGYKLDVYMSDLDAALDFGRKRLEVYIVKEQ